MFSRRAADPTGDRILVFEPDAEGHSQEWLQHLMDFAAVDECRPALCLVAPATLCRTLAQSMPTNVGERIRLVPLSPLELRLCTDRRLWVAAFARWWAMRRHLRRSGASSGFFLSLDLLSLPLALGLGAGGKPLSGILFRPSVHYRSFGIEGTSRREWLRDLRKDFLYRLMLRNPALRRVLSLDPFFPAHAARRYACGEKVQALPDPAQPIIEAAVPSGDAADKLPPERIGFLLFGYLTERKGPLVLLDALERLTPPVVARIAILLAGRVDPAIRDRLDASRRRLAARHPELCLHVDDRRLERAELESLVARSDVVLAPYQRFVGSSGVLLWAANARRPVLAQEYGLVGRLTRDHGLGLAADSSDPVRLAAAITQMVERGPQSFIDQTAARAFVQSQTPNRFAELVFAGGAAGLMA
jgi:glycosyltransferase involved in cell wall biosynthesis